MFHLLTRVVLLSTVGLLVGLTVLAWRNRTEPGARTFGVLQATSAVWVGLTLVGLQLSTGPLRIRVWGVTTGLSLLVVVLWFAFILRYTGREWLLRRDRLAVVASPLVAGAAVYAIAPTWSPFVEGVELTTTAAGTLVWASLGPLGSVLGIYLYLLFLVGIVVVVRTVLERETLFAGQAAAFVLGTLVTVVASALVLAGVPMRGYPLTQLALGGQSLLWGYAVFRQQFLRTVPAVVRLGRQSVVDELDEGVLVVESNGTVVSANPSARAFLDVDALVGEYVTTVFDRLGVSEVDDLPVRYEHQGETYEVRSSTVTNWQDEPIGYALVIRDVTELVRRQQRLEVLNRIFRHNVRNDMNVVLGAGNWLAESDDDQLTAVGDRLHRVARGLTAISEKAIRADRTLDRSAPTEAVDLSALVAEVVSEVATQYPSATLSTAVPETELSTKPEILSLVLDEVVENAAEHAGEAPEIRIESRRTGQAVRLTVADDGPGIPSSELVPVRSETETDLEHSTGIGLWLVRWGVRELGGSVDVTSSSEGSVVTLSIPDVRA